MLVDGDEVKLGDVAELSGGDERWVKELRSIRLCSAPLPGRSRELDQPYLEKRLAQNAVDLSRLSFSGAGKVIVQTAWAEITGAQIQAAVEERVYQRLPREDVILEFRNLAQKVILPQGKRIEGERGRKGERERGRGGGTPSPLHPLSPSGRGGEEREKVTLRAAPADDLPLKGNRVVYVEIFVGGLRCKRIPVSLKVRTFGEVLLCRRKVDRHHVFTAEDLIVERRETTTLPDDINLEIGDVVGKRAKAFIQSGRVIRRGMIEQPPVLHRGDLVTVRVSLKAIFITMEGEARADGRPGEIIPVRNIRSRREISAEVVDSKTVIVDW